MARFLKNSVIDGVERVLVKVVKNDSRMKDIENRLNAIAPSSHGLDDPLGRREILQRLNSLENTSRIHRNSIQTLENNDTNAENVTRRTLGLRIMQLEMENKEMEKYLKEKDEELEATKHKLKYANAQLRWYRAQMRNIQVAMEETAETLRTERQNAFIVSRGRRGIRSDEH